MGPRKRGLVLQLSSFSMRELHTRTSDPTSKSYSWMVDEKRLTNWAADCFLAFRTLADISRRSSGLFWSCWAWCAMRSSVEAGTSRGGRRYVASAMSSGRTASTPLYCAITALDGYPSHSDNIHYIQSATL